MHARPGARERRRVLESGPQARRVSDDIPDALTVDLHLVLQAALRIASEKYGGQVLLTGSVEFQGRAARMATRLGIRVTYPDFQGIVREAQQPYDHRAWTAASQRVREAREREGRAAEERLRCPGAAPPPPKDAPAAKQPASQTPPRSSPPASRPASDGRRIPRRPPPRGRGVDDGR